MHGGILTDKGGIYQTLMLDVGEPLFFSFLLHHAFPEKCKKSSTAIFCLYSHRIVQ